MSQFSGPRDSVCDMGSFPALQTDPWTPEFRVLGANCPLLIQVGLGHLEFQAWASAVGMLGPLRAWGRTCGVKQGDYRDTVT